MQPSMLYRSALSQGGFAVANSAWAQCSGCMVIWRMMSRGHGVLGAECLGSAPFPLQTCPDEVIRKMFFYPKWDKIVTCGRFKECHVVNPADFSKICTVDARPGQPLVHHHIGSCLL